MKNNKRLLSLAHEILEQMYEEATPPADFHRAKDYRDHVLGSERQQEIIDTVLKRKRLTDRERTAIGFYVFDNSPFTAVDLEE